MAAPGHSDPSLSTQPFPASTGPSAARSTRLGEARDALLARITEALAADARVMAAWLSGSIGRGETDEWSDLDLHVAIADDAFEAFMAERPSLYARVGRPLLIQAEFQQSDSQPGARFQLVWFEGPVEVDWNVGPVSAAVRPATSRVLFDRAGVPVSVLPPLTPEQRRARAEERLIFFWAMAPIAVKLAGRGDARRVANQISLMSNAYISLWRLVHRPDGPEPYVPAANRPLEPALDAVLPVTGSEITPQSALAVITTLCAETERLHPALAALGVPIPAEMPAAVREISAVAEAVIREGRFPRVRFR